ncbi:MAG: helicase-exonuclease AddAB subunit AddA [Oscillospiraceae bacterium]|jgi:ATP-dependent helicase/nuclease subunit A|nr:helicase-exonuclease AddAB subunit AddA [Oscillospiraceae bacterium]
MSELLLTDEQALAVKRRSGLLVSAAAGSGKTRVLVSRLLDYIKDEASPCHVDDFLIITYTRAAAAQLRAKILDELTHAANEAPSDKYLRRELSRCYRAQIGTIHSFCATLLRENSAALNLSPDFSIGDEEKCRALMAKALEKSLDSAYEKIGEDSGFACLASTVGAGRDDSRLEAAVLSLHSKLQSHPYPELWARECAEAMAVQGVSDLSQTRWGALLMQNARETAQFWQKRLEGVWLELCQDPEENAPLISAYGESLTVTLQSLENFLIAARSSWDRAYAALPIAFPRLGSLRKYEFEDRKLRFTSARNAAKKVLAALGDTFDAPSELLLADLAKTAPAALRLLELTLDFERRYCDEKRKSNLLDFSDLEHLALKLLHDPISDAPTQLARRLSERYREIMIDEYQDVNAVQELIAQCISKNGENVFMVGDVKQSIYRFRLADPGIFLKKLESFPKAEHAAPNERATVLLSRNFRSDSRILDACNAVFSALMSESLGEVDYSGSHALRAPEDAPEPRGETLFTIIGAGGKDDDEDKPEKHEYEAAFTARRIKAMVERGETISENGQIRPLRYGDFAILLFTPNTVGGFYKQALLSEGVPVASAASDGFFKAPEIVVTTSLLSAINEPWLDVPLAAALSSRVFGFTPDDLAILRLAASDCPLFDALIAAAETSEKCRATLETLRELRTLSRLLSVRELLGYIYEKLSLPALWSTGAHSDKAAANLAQLLSLAADFESELWRGLSDFLLRLELMRSRGAQPLSPAESRDAVTIMSVHKSKGLEFPVVFLCDMAHGWNKTQLSSPVLVHSQLGLGLKLTDLERGAEYPTAAFKAVRDTLFSEQLSEQLRVLYVAMTRAREKLFISCCVPDAPGFVAKVSESFSPPCPELLRRAPNPAVWLACAALADKTAALPLEIAEGASLLHEAPEQLPAPSDPQTETSVASITAEALRAALEKSYPYEYAENLPSKITATALTRYDEAFSDAAPLISPPKRSFDPPSLAQSPLMRSFDSPAPIQSPLTPPIKRSFDPLEPPHSPRKITAAERGTATHAVMQRIDFSKVGSLSEIKDEIARLSAAGFLDELSANSVDSDTIFRFFSSPLGQRVLAADKLWREFRFSLLVPAIELLPNSGAKDEKILLQGIIDCCVQESGVLTIIDYKTDHVTPETLAEKSAHYAPQLQTYMRAMAKITGKPVASGVLVFLRSGLEAHFPP